MNNKGILNWICGLTILQAIRYMLPFLIYSNNLILYTVFTTSLCKHKTLSNHLKLIAVILILQQIVQSEITKYVLTYCANIFHPLATFRTKICFLCWVFFPYIFPSITILVIVTTEGEPYEKLSVLPNFTWKGTAVDSPDYMNNHLYSWLAWQAAFHWRVHCDQESRTVRKCELLTQPNSTKKIK